MDDLVTKLKALADKSRFDLIVLLLNKDLCVTAVAKHLRLSEGAVSQHLKVLREAGLVTGEKRGYFTHYSVKTEALLQIASDLKDLPNVSICLCQSCRDSDEDEKCCREEDTLDG